MFTNLCLILLLLLAGSLQFRNSNYRKKAEKKSRKRSNIVQLADGVTALAQFYALYSHGARSFNQWQRALYPNFIVKWYRESPGLHHVDPSKTRKAPYSQGDVVVFGQNAGQQCVAMSLCALMYHNMKGIGNPDDLKQIMLIGSQLYSSLSQLSRQSFLLLTDLP